MYYILYVYINVLPVKFRIFLFLSKYWVTQKKRQRQEEGNHNGIVQEIMTVLPPLGVLLGNFRSSMKKGKL